MKTLLLDKQYQAISFIPLRDLAKHIVKDKVEVMSVWSDKIFHAGQLYPAVVRLKETIDDYGNISPAYIRKKPRVPKFNRKAVFKRDDYTCQYTGRKLPKGMLNMDHIFPESRGGRGTWENCVAADKVVNSLKGNRTPEEAGLKLIRQPRPPAMPLTLEYQSLVESGLGHDDWSMYFVK